MPRETPAVHLSGKTPPGERALRAAADETPQESRAEDARILLLPESSAAQGAPGRCAAPGLQETRDLGEMSPPVARASRSRLASRSSTLIPDVADIKIVGTERARDGHTKYRLAVACNGGASFVTTSARRYSEFDALHQKLQDVAREGPRTGGGGSRVRMPVLPPKGWCRAVDENFLARRKRMLEDYIRAVANIPVLAGSSVVRRFLKSP